MRRAGTGLLALLIMTGPLRAGADDTHYHDYPLGGRAVGLGGAFVALASDPSGLYYNPAGIVDSRLHSVQVSTNLYGLEVSDTFVDAFGQVADLDTVFTDLNIIPSSAAFTGVIDADENDRPTTSYAIGSFVPSYRSLNIDSSSAVADGTCEQLSYERSILDRTFLFGAGTAHRLDDTWQFGAAMFMAYRSLRDREEVACFGARENGGQFSTTSTNLNLAAAAILLSFGVKANLGHGLYLGGTVTSPSIRAFDSGSIRVRRGSVDANTGDSRFFLRELDGLSANTNYGTAIRAGLAWVIPRKATLAFDLDFRAPTKYALVEVPVGETEFRDAITLTTQIERKAVVNLNVGGEFLFMKGFSMSAGFFTNFSSAPEIPGDRGQTFDQDYLPNVDAFGGSLVAGFFGENTLTRLGFTMSYGEGTDVVPRSEGLAALGQSVDYLKIDSSQLFVYFFVSSTFRY